MPLEHNVHKQQRNMPNLQAEHWSEYSEVFQDVTNSDSSNFKVYEFFQTHSFAGVFPNALICRILNISLRALVTPATLWASVTLVTGQTKSMGQSEPYIILMSLVLQGEIVTHVVILFLSFKLNQVNIL